MNNLTVLVTGASSGIGAALSRKLLAHGAQVIGLCRRVDELPDGIRPLQCDLSQPDKIREAFSSLDQLDILVNNAGVALLSRIMDGNVDDWETMWQINVRAPALCCQLALPLLPKGGGRILNISSLSGHRVPPTGGFYAPTKFALRALSDALRSELKADGSKTQVGCLSPGFVDTPLLDHYFSGREDELAQTRAKIKMLSPEEIADVALHILTAPPSVEINDILLRSPDQIG